MLNNEDYLNIFHEIKNSITLIGSSLQLVAKKHPEVNAFDYWNEAMSEIAFLRNMVTELSSARLSDHLNLSIINLADFFHEIQNSIHSLSSRDFYFQFMLSDNMEEIEMDAHLMKQAIINLLKNAYEAMHQTGTVIINVTRNSSMVHIAIIDQGGGLDPAFADNIFEPFITSKTGGSGLGLVITKQIIESHHGTIACESRPGDGCTFAISLPLKQS